MIANKPVQKLKRQFLIRAHDTNLWASHLPHLPSWLYLLTIAGAGLLAFAIFAPALTIISATLIAVVGLLLCLPLIIMLPTMRKLWRRRADVRQEILDTVAWRGDEAVLDVGCGGGMLLNGAAKRLTSGTALGIDIWAEHGGGGSRDFLFENAQKEGVADRIQFEEVDARNMYFDDESFDVVLSSWAIHHIIRSREEFEKLSQEMIRVLKPGGTMTVLDTAHMIDALAIRLETAGLNVEIKNRTDGQKIIIGKKPVA